MNCNNMVSIKMFILNFKAKTLLPYYSLVISKLLCTRKKLWIFFLLILGVAFVAPSQCSFPELQLHVIKKLWNQFCCILFLFASVQMVCLRFLSFSFKLEILPLSPVVSFCSTFSFKVWHEKLLQAELGALQNCSYYKRIVQMLIGTCLY